MDPMSMDDSKIAGNGSVPIEKDPAGDNVAPEAHIEHKFDIANQHSIDMNEEEEDDINGGMKHNPEAVLSPKEETLYMDVNCENINNENVGEESVNNLNNTATGEENYCHDGKLSTKDGGHNDPEEPDPNKNLECNSNSPKDTETAGGSSGDDPVDSKMPDAPGSNEHHEGDFPDNPTDSGTPNCDSQEVSTDPELINAPRRESRFNRYSKVKKGSKPLSMGGDRSRSTKCHLCGVAYKKKSFRDHMQFVHGDFMHQCNLCKKLFHRPNSLKTHLFTQHGISRDESKVHINVIKKGDITPEMLLPVRNPSPSKGGILSSIVAFNCFDCTASFGTMKELFDHCDIHRVSSTGQKYPFLVPPKLRVY